MFQKTILMGALIFLGAAGWQIGGRLSPDAIGMGVGVLFGVMAGLPTALLVLAGNRRHEAPTPMPPALTQQPPIIILNGSRQLSTADTQSEVHDIYADLDSWDVDA